MPSRNKTRSAGSPASLFIKLNRSRPLGEQISHRIRVAIQEKRLVPGDRLPSLRQLAQDLSVSIDTVQDSYRLLADEGRVQARQGAGYYVCEELGNSLPSKGESIAAQQKAPSINTRQPSSRILEKTLRARQNIPFDYRTNERTPLATYASGMECIAEKHFLRFAAQLARSPWLHNSYSDPQGYLPLRHAICRKLRQFQGLIIQPEQIVITSGLVQSLNLLSEVLFAPGDRIWLENPGYSTVEDTLRFRQLSPVFVPVDSHGFDVTKALELEPTAKGLFVSSASQYPLSVPLSSKQVQPLLEWSRQSGGWIIEDGTDGILSLTGKPYRSLLQQSEGHEGVVYVDSFSLQIAPGFRMGYIVLPRAFAEVCTAAKFLSDRNSGESAQALLAEFLDSAPYESYIRRLNRRYCQRFKVLQAAVAEKLSKYGYLMPAQFGCRVAFILTVPVNDIELSAALTEDGIPLRSLSTCCRSNNPLNGLILGFGTSSESEIWNAVERIALHCAELS